MEKPYFNLHTNEYGKKWLFYNPDPQSGLYQCWMPINDEFYDEFKKLLASQPSTKEPDNDKE